MRSLQTDLKAEKIRRRDGRSPSVNSPLDIRVDAASNGLDTISALEKKKSNEMVLMDAEMIFVEFSLV
ncbi:MAG TPA: hypothetical protein PLQ38_05715 [Methanothrix sp.]|nr:hypothetical protein [Methanothrix sp.]